VEQAVLAEIMKRRIEVGADQQYRNALRQKLEEERVAQDREQQFIELFKRLDPAGRDLAISIVEGIASQQERSGSQPNGARVMGLSAAHSSGRTIRFECRWSGLRANRLS
jgi:hypothetical protein